MVIRLAGQLLITYAMHLSQLWQRSRSAPQLKYRGPLVRSLDDNPDYAFRWIRRARIVVYSAALDIYSAALSFHMMRLSHPSED